MFKAFRFATIAVFAFGLVVIALGNRAPVEVRLLPENLAALFGMDLRVTLPVFLVIFLAMAAGLLIGFVWEWFREHKHRANARTKGKEVSRLERELAVMKDSANLPKDDVLAILEAAKAR